MKILITTFLFIISFVTISAWASHAEHNHVGLSEEKTVAGVEGATCEDTINVKVNGLVCDFCARSIEKLFSKEKSVKSVNINLEKMVISISLKNAENLDDNSIKKIITDSGYDVVGILRE